MTSQLATTEALHAQPFPTEALPTEALPTEALPTEAMPSDALPADSCGPQGLAPGAVPVGDVEDSRRERYSVERIERNSALKERLNAAQKAMSSAMAEILEVTAEADAAETYWADGSQAVDEWLVAHLRVHSRTARRWTKLSRRLLDYPEMRARLRAGDMVLDQVWQLLKYVEPDREAEALDDAVWAAADEIASWAREAQTVPPDRTKKIRSERWYEGFFDHDDMIYRFAGAVPGQDGLLVDKAFQLLAWNAPEEPAWGMVKTSEHRMADALVEMASNALANEATTDVATVVVHADAAKLAAPDAVGYGEFGTDVPMEAIRRMCCDGRVQLVTRDECGVLGVGRVQRTIPPWLKRLIRTRDKGCRFPGCSRTYWTEIHHIVHWAHGGPTDIHNLITLCGHHHRMLHEDGWSIGGDAGHEVEFRLPSGRPFAPRKPIGDWKPFREFDLKSIGDWAQRQGLARPGPG